MTVSTHIAHGNQTKIQGFLHTAAGATAEQRRGVSVTENTRGQMQTKIIHKTVFQKICSQPGAAFTQHIGAMLLLAQQAQQLKQVKALSPLVRFQAAHPHAFFAQSLRSRRSRLRSGSKKDAIFGALL